MLATHTVTWWFSPVLVAALVGCAPKEPHPELPERATPGCSDRGSHAEGSGPPGFLFDPVGRRWLEPHPSLEDRPSLIQVLTHPHQYHGRNLSVGGHLVVVFEGDAIYLSETAARYSDTRNAFWVSFENNEMRTSRKEIAKQFDGKYVFLAGTFDENAHGMYQGGFKHITGIAVAKDRSEEEVETRKHRESERIKARRVIDPSENRPEQHSSDDTD